MKQKPEHMHIEAVMHDTCLFLATQPSQHQPPYTQTLWQELADTHMACLDTWSIGNITHMHSVIALYFHEHKPRKNLMYHRWCKYMTCAYLETRLQKRMVDAGLHIQYDTQQLRPLVYNETTPNPTQAMFHIQKTQDAMTCTVMDKHHVRIELTTHNETHTFPVYGIQPSALCRMFSHNPQLIMTLQNL